MVKSGYKMERTRQKDEWSFASVDLGGKCVTMAGMKWTQKLSVVNLDMETQVVGELMNNKKI